MGMTKLVGVSVAVAALVAPGLDVGQARAVQVTASEPAAVLEAGTAQAQVGVARGRGLKVLLTNDDGYSAPGLQSVYQALTSAGYDVTVFAPKTKQSGAGATQTFATLEVSQPVPGDPKVFAVSGTPADTVALAMEAVFRSDRPDLVISGCNYGENVGWGVNLSGTVGAAVTATAYGVPAIACSSEGDYSDPTYGTPDYQGSAVFVTRLVRYLDKHRDELKAMRGKGLNVNFPFLSAGKLPKGVVHAKPEPISKYHLSYQPEAGNPNVYKVDWAMSPSRTRNTDFSLLERDWITITPMHATFLDSGAKLGKSMAKRLNRLYS
jgi:5'/3'-nucleotidase SurE